MKRIVTILSAVLLTTSLLAQSPEKMSYQALIRNSSNQLITNHAVGMQIIILQGSTGGAAVYAETQTPSTNDNGLVSIEIGGGTVLSGDFTTIDWADGPYFIKTEIDPDGGTSYTITSTSQLLSVPYALYARAAGNGFSGNYDDLSNKPTTDGSETKLSAGTNVTVTGSGTTASPYVVNATGSSSQHYLGEIYSGGIIFYIYMGSDGLQHGLIVSATESTSAYYSSTASMVFATRPDDGAYNTNLMINSTAKTWVTGLGAGWYLPSQEELILLFNNRFHVDKTIITSGSGTIIYNGVHWSSTEATSTNAIAMHFYTGAMSTELKSASFRVRAIKSF
jgi:hypothetical protein